MIEYFWKSTRVPAQNQMSEATYNLLDYANKTIIKGLKHSDVAEKIVEEHNKAIASVFNLINSK